MACLFSPRVIMLEATVCKAKTLGSFMAQPFSIGKGHGNILVRPMAYDVNLKEADLFAWHDAIYDAAAKLRDPRDRFRPD